MGLFDDDGDDSEKSFRERVNDIREAREDAQQPPSSSIDENSGPSRSPETLVDQAQGDIELKHLTQTSGRVQSWLYEEPIVKYLHEDEQPEFIFTDINNGLQFKHPDGTEGSIEGSSQGGVYFLVITDKRLLYVAGSKGGDEVLERQFEKIQTVGSDSGWVTTKLNFTDTDGVEYAFDVTDDVGQRKEAMAYIREQIGKQTSEEKYLSGVSASDSPEVSTVGSEVSRVGNDVQQWEYLTYRLDDSQNLNIVDASLRERITSDTSGPPLPPDEVLNQLGKQGWKLVETVEKPAREAGDFTSTDGSMTYAYVFRRPVDYSVKTDENDAGSEDT